MYQDVIFYAQSTIREFEDLRLKLKKEASSKEIHEVLTRINKRLIFFIKYNIKSAREYRREFDSMCRNIENHLSIDKLLDSLEERMIRLRNLAIKADKKEEIVKEFVLR
ncbi:MAG: hypothetical protein AABW88_05185 [Nanoarchaeota archaeon]